MAALVEEHVTEITHWNDTLFSFKTTRSDSFRFANGHFVMLGLRVDGKPLLRAYSIASANYDEYLEFFSIKVQDGPLTSRLQHLKSVTVCWSAKSQWALLSLMICIQANAWCCYPQVPDWLLSSYHERPRGL